MSLTAVADMLREEHTQGLVLRAADELKRAIKSNADGISIIELDAVSCIAETTALRLAEPDVSHALAPPLCGLLTLLGSKPLRTQRANESVSAVTAMHRMINVLAELLLCQHVPIARSAAEALTGFAAATYDRDTTRKQATGSAPSSEALPSTWQRNQKAVLDSGAVPMLVDAFHNLVQQLLDSTGQEDDVQDTPLDQTGEQARDAVDLPRAEAHAMHEQKSPLGATGRSIGGYDSSSDDTDDMRPVVELPDNVSPISPSFDSPTEERMIDLSGVDPSRAAGVPALLEGIVKLLGALSEHAGNSAELVAAGAAGALVALLDVVLDFRDAVVPLAIETLWNMAEHSTAALASSSTALSLQALLRKHRTHNACFLLSTVSVFGVLASLLERLLLGAHHRVYKATRNEVVILATLLARTPCPPPSTSSSSKAELNSLEAVAGGGGLVLESGLLHLALTYACACEMGLPVPAPFRNFGSVEEDDMELKRLLWDLIYTALKSEADAAAYSQAATREATRRAQVQTLRAGAAGQHGMSVDMTEPSGTVLYLPVLDAVRESMLIPTLLLYLDPRQRRHPYLSAWSDSHRRTLEISALSLLLHLAPRALPEFGEAGGPVVLLLFLRKHAAVLSVRQLRGGGMATLVGDGTQSSPALPGEAALEVSQLDSASLAASGMSADGLAGRAGVKAALANIAAETSQLADGEPDDDRAYLALRLIAATCGAGAGVTGLHVLRAAAATGGTADMPGTSNGALQVVGLEALPDVVPAEVDYAGVLGELGAVEDVVAILADRSEQAQAVVATALGEDAPEGAPPRALSVAPKSMIGRANAGAASVFSMATGAQSARASSASLGVLAATGGAATSAGHVVEAAALALAALCQPRSVPSATLGITGDEHHGDDAAAVQQANAVSVAQQAAEECNDVAAANRERLRAAGGVGLLLQWLLVCVEAHTAATRAAADKLAAAHAASRGVADTASTSASTSTRIDASFGRVTLQTDASGAAMSSTPGDAMAAALAKTSIAPGGGGRLPLGLEAAPGAVRARLAAALGLASANSVNQSDGVGAGVTPPAIAAATVAALWCACVTHMQSDVRDESSLDEARRAGNSGPADQLGAAVLLASSGVEALLDLLEVAPMEARGVIVGLLADITSVPGASAYLSAWRSELTGASTIALCLRLWAEEELRLGVPRAAYGQLLPVHTAGTSIADAVDGVLHAMRAATLVADSDGRSCIEGKPSGLLPAPAQGLSSGQGGSISHDHQESTSGDVSDALRQLSRRLLEPLQPEMLEALQRLSPTMQLRGVRGASSGSGAGAAANESFRSLSTSGVGVGPRSSGVLNAFERLREALRATQLWTSAAAGQKTSPNAKATGAMPLPSLPAVVMGNADLRPKLWALLDGLDWERLLEGSAGDFSPVRADPVAACTFELASRYTEFLYGEAWDDVAAALTGQGPAMASLPRAAWRQPVGQLSVLPRMGLPLPAIEPIEPDAEMLLAKLEEVASAASAVRAQQDVIAADASAAARAAEQAVLHSTLAQRAADEQNATLAVASRLRKKAMRGDGMELGVEERRTARMQRDAMLASARTPLSSM